MIANRASPADDSMPQWMLKAVQAYEVERPALEAFLERYPPEAATQLRPALECIDGLGAVRQEVLQHADNNGVSTSDMPETIGPYRIVRMIGRGGMGVVYEAVRTGLDKKVALKVLPDRTVPHLLERFLREARTAAGLHHTNIVPVFDAGQADDGVPYYAMQFIEGRSFDLLLHNGSGEMPPRASNVPVTVDHVADIDARGAPELARDTTRDLPEPRDHAGTTAAANRYDQRLIADWGLQAALGLAYAHQRGIVHRDIKPSNLILDARGVVLIADFGLAYRHGDPALTAAGDILGTPRYMSPEQAGGKHLDCRTDVYSLGVTLYELATGQKAFSGESRAQVIQQVCDGEPTHPRQIVPQLSRDLEKVILKAMAKRPEDRYQGTQELADDLRRFLEGNPVRARRITRIEMAWRRVQKYGKQPIVRVLSATVVLTLIGGLILAGYFAWTAWNRAKAAQAQRAEANHTVRLWTESTLEIAGKPFAQESVRRQLQISRDYYERQAARAPADVGEEIDRAVALRLLGDIEASLGRHGEAEQNYRQSVLLLERLADGPAKHLHIRQELARNHNNLGNLLHRLRRTDAEFHLLRAVDLHQQLANTNHHEPNHRRETATSWCNVAIHWQKTWRFRDALDAQDRAIDLQTKLVQTFPEPKYRQELARTLMNRGTLLESLGDLDKANKDARAAQDHLEKLVENNMNESTYKGELASTLNNLSILAMKTGRPSEAEQLLHRARNIQSALVVEYAAVPDFRLKLGRTLLNLGRLYTQTERLKEAEATYLQGISELEKLVAAFPALPEFVLELARMLNNRSDLFWLLGKKDKARSDLDRAIHLLTEFVADSTALPEHRWELARCRANLGTLFKRLGDITRARTEYEISLDLYGKLSLDCSGDPQCDHESAMVRVSLAAVLDKLGEFDAALGTYRAALASEKALASRWPDAQSYKLGYARASLNLGVLYHRRGQQEEANDLLRNARDMLRKPAAEPKNAAVYKELFGLASNTHANTLKMLNHPSEAMAAYEDALTAQRELVAKYPKVTEYRWHLGMTLHNQSLLLQQSGNVPKSMDVSSEALKFLSELVAEMPTRPEYRRNLLDTIVHRASLLQKRGDTEGSRRLFQRQRQLLRESVQLWPTNPATHNELAWFLATCPDPQMRNPCEAVSAAERAIELNSQSKKPNGEFWNTLGAAQYRAGAWAEAVIALNESMRLQRENAYDLFFRAMAFHQQNDAKAARKDYDRAITLMGTSTDEVLWRIRQEAAKLLGFAM